MTVATKVNLAEFRIVVLGEVADAQVDSLVLRLGVFRIGNDESLVGAVAFAAVYFGFRLREVGFLRAYFGGGSRSGILADFSVSVYSEKLVDVVGIKMLGRAEFNVGHGFQKVFLRIKYGGADGSPVGVF